FFRRSYLTDRIDRGSQDWSTLTVAITQPPSASFAPAINPARSDAGLSHPWSRAIVRPGGTVRPLLGGRANNDNPASAQPGSRPRAAGQRAPAGGPGVASRTGLKERP